jgi:lysozyme family protein
MVHELRFCRSRRWLLGSAASAMLIGGHPRPWRACAQQSERPSVNVTRIENAARALGIAVPGAGAARSARLLPEQQDAYNELMPRLVNLIDRANASGSVGADIARQADDLLAAIHEAEHGGKAEDPARRAPASFESVRGEYKTLFDTCQIDPQKRPNVEENANLLQLYKPRYEKVGKALGIPWYFIGAIHCLEAGFRFVTHLHNGDPLAQRTVHVPRGQPVVWNPPSDWESSAEDALKAYANQQDWSLEHLLYRWEGYNGWGYHGRINSPYLWSFSNQYTAGKYVKDGVFDAHFVSSQCGTAVMLKVLMERGEAAKPQ